MSIRYPELFFKKFAKTVFFALPFWLLILSCTQSPIFYEISNEVEPKDPLIKGAPSAIVEFQAASETEPALYVGRKSLFIYTAGNRRWTDTGKAPPSGSIHELAATEDHLYALTMLDASPWSAKLWKTTGAPGWEWKELGKEADYPILQGIYAAGDTLFCGARHSDLNMHVVYFDSGDNLEYVTAADGGYSFPTSNGRLVGAASHGANYFIATTSAGIFTGPDPKTLLGTGCVEGSDPGALITGIISLNGTILAVTNNELILKGDTNKFESMASYSNVRFTGSLALWDNGETYLLLLGIQMLSNVYTFGYREIRLSGTGDPPQESSPALQIPGGEYSSIENRARYQASLGRHVIVSLKQTPGSIDPGRILFASTQKNGLWSYRNKEWNAEP